VESHDGHRNLAKMSSDHPRRIIDEKYTVDRCPQDQLDAFMSKKKQGFYP